MSAVLVIESTFILKVQMLKLLLASVAESVTVVVPTLKHSPERCELPILIGPPQLSCTLKAAHENAPHVWF